MSTRVVIFGVGNILLGLWGLLVCLGVLLTSLGLGVIVAASSLKGIGAGFLFGSMGAFFSLFLALFCLFQAYAGAAMMRGRSLGFTGGLVIAGFYLLTSWGTSLAFALFGAFGLWALLTSRDRF